MNEFGCNLKEVEELGASTGKFDIQDGHYLCIVESIRKVYFDWGTNGSIKPGFYEYDESLGLKPEEVSYELKFQVIDGENTGKQLIQILSTNSTNDTVSKIARSTLKSLFISLNVDLDKGTVKDLVNRPVMVEFGHYTPKIKPGEQPKQPRLTIRKIYAKDSSPVASKVATQTTSTPTKEEQPASKPGWGTLPSWSK